MCDSTGGKALRAGLCWIHSSLTDFPQKNHFQRKHPWWEKTLNPAEGTLWPFSHPEDKGPRGAQHSPWALPLFFSQITFIPADLETQRFLDHKPMVLPQKDAGLIAPCPSQEATSPYEKSLPSYEQIQRLSSAPPPGSAQPRPRSCSQSAVQARAEIHRELGGAGDPLQDLAPRLETAAGSCPAPGDAPLASLLEEMDTPSLEGSVPGSPTPQSRTPGSSGAGGEQPRAPRKGPGEEDDLYYGLREDALLKESDGVFEPEN
ncbi:barttin isoform X1 [Oenanthe melanoleuca]|uniref:barttin isoform X1 n=1 Tax=Oenanthe melanoleuca TaxID=2939378 RepID=UPI0024C1CD2D|nr:barttin isoform X1 [Oenanthe melanoleuca]